MTTAVLLPLRLESRFTDTRLRLRVIPDEPWFDRHDPLPSAAELDALERYRAAAGADQHSQEALAAWRAFAGEHGPGRAAWLVRTFPPGAPRPAQLSTEARTTDLVEFPHQLQVWLARGGGQPAHAATLPPVDPAKLRLDPGDPDDPQERRWWESWDVAVAAGLAVEIELGERADDIDALYVVGLSTAAPATLFAKHRDAGMLGLLAAGAPTNSVEGGATADVGADPMPWLSLLHRPVETVERRVSLALTGDRDLLGALPGGDLPPHHLRARLLLTGLWPALCGHTLADVLGLADVDRVADWATRNVEPLGPFPALRIGTQPYGLLPTTALADWVAPADDPQVEAVLRGPLRTLRARLAEAARSGGRGAVLGADADHLLELLAQPPASPGYALRRMHPVELWFSAILGTEHPITFPELIVEWDRTYPLVGELGVRPRRRYADRGSHHTMNLPLVTPPGLPAGQTAGDLLAALVRLARQTPTAFASTRAVTDAVGQRLTSLLLRLALYALQVAVGDVGRHVLGVPPGTLDPVATRPDVPQLLSAWIGAVTADDLAADTPPANALRRLSDALQTVARVPDAELESVLPATIDCASHRIDPWVTGIARRRLRRMSPQSPLLGGYGWVDRPRPGRPGPTGGGLLLAPSHPQALTAALIRDRAINDPEPGRWHMDITSDRVRRAARLADDVREGAHPAEVLGREVERAVGEPSTIQALRDRFPIRDEHAGRRVCDGQRVLAASPGTLGLPADVLAELDRWRAAVDVYADLLVAEAVHHVVDGRASVAGAALDAAAGLARPPVLDVLRTRRPGRAVETSCVTVLPDTTAAALPDDPRARAAVPPARLTDPAVAALLVAQLGPAGEWRWQLGLPDGTTTTVRLSDLDLEPADALAVPLGTLEKLLTAPAPAATVIDRDGGVRYGHAARLVALLGRVPAVAADTTEAGTPADSPADATTELRERLSRLRAVAGALLDQLAAAAAGGDADDRRAALRLAVRWGIVPEPDPTAADSLAEAVDRARRVLRERLFAAPDDTAAESLDPVGLAAAVAALASPTGQVAVLGRLRRDALPRLDEGLDPAWLVHVAPVRPPLARLEAFQLAAGTSAGRGPAWTAWTNRAADPWQRDPADRRRLVVVHTPPAVDLTATPPEQTLAVGLLDRFAETIPDVEQDATAAFGFDAPGGRAPQAILLAVPPDPNRPLDEATLVGIVAETRELAHARMATPADLDQIAGVAPLILLPATGDTSSGLET